MASLLIKDIPREVHDWLKREAARNRRSMTQQAIVLLEERMHRFRPVKFPAPERTRTPLTAEFIDQAKREGRTDCQNLFCEVDKYSRAAHPEIKASCRTRIKQRFVPAPKPTPQWYPPKWGLLAQWGSQV